MISQSLDHGHGGPAAAGAAGAVEETAPARYASNARVVREASAAPGRISVLA